MFSDRIKIGRDLLDVPMGEMIKDMAFAIAEAQLQLDRNSMEIAEMMGGLHSVEDANTGKTTFEDSRVFFGEQVMTADQAVVLYNSTTDEYLKKELKDNSNVIVNSNIATLASTASGTEKVRIRQRLSLMELGFTPTFYQFVDTIIEVKINIRYTAEQSSSVSSSFEQKRKDKTKNKTGWFWKRNKRKTKTVTTTQVNASFSQKFSYSAEGSSLLRTKLVPIPPPAILEERIQQQMEIARSNALPTP